MAGQPAVGVRLPLATPSLSAAGLLEICVAGHELGYRSVWLGDHVVLPTRTSSAYPHTSDAAPPFDSSTPWLDPLITLGWLASRLPAGMRLGTSVLILPLRNPVLLAKQLSTLSWLVERDLGFGVGSGWLREEYEAVGAPFEGRATAARHAITTIRALLRDGGGDLPVQGEELRFSMLPRVAGAVHFLWGGVSPLALRIAAGCCDGWLPAKQPLESLPGLVDGLRAECDAADRDFTELRLVAKPGAGPDPRSGAIDADSLAEYAKLGFAEVVLELPYESGGPGPAIDVLAQVAHRSDL